ncbi:CRISPR-associated endonuclease Cas3'' [Rhodovulum tesquicola]|uniref:CRISPR-associated endonuclease Cas3'' n=1 Tax=Rhodovulum tesquicola TaxID=540254 RepID=UPI0020971F81|nr:CRISPR-associated endonuclease Cas3'' [Rhodovulum tesquicola]MCO8145193.1 CRISPR-associated endonuclease Cas3'' [Rhodovulum tesquicola]
MPIYAHSVPGRPVSEWENLRDHSEAVAWRAALFAEPFGGREAASALGWAHDLGKMKPRFQAKLLGEWNTEPHSAEGARLLLSRHGKLGPLLAACVAGHHSGLPDLDDLTRRLATLPDPALPDWMPAPTALAPFGPLSSGAITHFSIQFAVRMLFSCLVDADELETAAFYDGIKGRPVSRAPETLTQAHRRAYDAHIARFGATQGRVNALRAEILRHARAQAANEPGLFTLTVPTGGGKTLTSLGFALDHALAHGLERVIHVIPYTSIVEQTADVFGTALGPDQVVEHHSSFDWDAVDDDEDIRRLRRVTRNWDAPVIVTTAVQFLESLFAARKRRCAKLHNLARAVIVIDEAQTMPRRLLRPCLAALTELTRHYGATVVLSTATQPVLTRKAGLDVPEALEDPRELAPDPPRLYAELRRARVIDIGPQDDTALSDRIARAPQVLAIVNNRRHARRLFDMVAGLPGARHLSTTMTSQHRRQVLAEIRDRLVAGLPVRLISTSLVEAGVDVDFPLVLRAAAGIDSIAQAAGRCNREGRLDGMGEVIVFTPSSEGSAPPEEVKQMAEIGVKILAAHKDDPLSEQAVADYFRALLWSQGIEALDAARVGPECKSGILREIAESGSALAFRFEQIAQAFRMIDDTQSPVIVRGGRWGISDDLLRDLTHATGTGGIARALQPFVVNLPHHIRRELETSRAASLWREDLFGREFLLLDHAGLYDDRAGMRMDRFDEGDFFA